MSSNVEVCLVNENDPESLSSDLRAGRLIRELRQHLESLGRAGVQAVPRSTWQPPAREHVESIIKEAPPPAQEPPSVRAFVPPAVTSPPPRAPAPGPALSFMSSLEEPGFPTEPMPAADRPAALLVLADEVAACWKCAHLAASRTQTVFGDGNPTAKLMFVGEAPGADEDRLGVPFVGRAGQLLTDMITKGMGLRREEVYIANVLKCRPPGNREPSLEESANCRSFLERQIEIVRPEFLCLLGRSAAFALLGSSLSMARLRRRWYRYRGIPTMATYHPSYLLRTPSAKKDAWQDLQMLMHAMGLKIPERRKHQD
ncbi:MAG: uracil-DNA glycosylase [Isosphaeraceae bacterium]